MNTISKFYNKSTLAMFALVAAMAPGLVFAQTTPEFDVTPITDKITLYIGYGLALASAIILGLWTLKVTGLLKPKS
jgi:hypothetical protein